MLQRFALSLSPSPVGNRQTNRIQQDLKFRFISLITEISLMQLWLITNVNESETNSRIKHKHRQLKYFSTFIWKTFPLHALIHRYLYTNTSKETNVFEMFVIMHRHWAWTQQQQHKNSFLRSCCHHTIYNVSNERMFLMQEIWRQCELQLFRVYQQRNSQHATRSEVSLMNWNAEMSLVQLEFNEMLKIIWSETQPGSVVIS